MLRRVDELCQHLRTRYVINSRRVHLEEFLNREAARLPQGAMVLDAGAGSAPYRQIFSHTHYVTADFCQVAKEYGQIDHVCDLSIIPVNEASFDAVIFTQVMEHLPDPLRVLLELNRILKPNGTLIWSAPLYFEEHEVPFDFYRYTQFGMRHLLHAANFIDADVQWMEGYFGTLSYQSELAIRDLPWHPRHYGKGLSAILTALLSNAVFRPVLLMQAILFSRVDVKFKYTERGHCTDYLGTARKPVR